LAEKYQSKLYNDRCRVLSFQTNPRIIIWCCLLGNVRSASSGDAVYFRPRSAIFPGRHRPSFSFRSVSENNVFLPRWVNVFPAYIGWALTKKPSRHTFKILWATPNNKTSFTVKKYYWPAFVKKKTCVMFAEKYQSRLFNYWCWPLFFQFNPWIILGWYLLGNVRSASSGDAFYFRPWSTIFPGQHRLSFSFRLVSENNVFLPRWVNVFLAE